MRSARINARDGHGRLLQQAWAGNSPLVEPRDQACIAVSEILAGLHQKLPERFQEPIDNEGDRLPP